MSHHAPPERPGPRRFTVLCTACRLALKVDEVLTIGVLGPRECSRCGAHCPRQGDDFDVVWGPL